MVQISKMVASMQEDPKVLGLDVTVNKVTGIVRLTAQSVDGRNTTQTMIGAVIAKDSKLRP